MVRDLSRESVSLIQAALDPKYDKMPFCHVPIGMAAPCTRTELFAAALADDPGCGWARMKPASLEPTQKRIQSSEHRVSKIPRVTKDCEKVTFFHLVKSHYLWCYYAVASNQTDDFLCPRHHPCGHHAACFLSLQDETSKCVAFAIRVCGFNRMPG
jgi:hypothetical protein